ncbi:hypothetical protein EHYA_03877 [Embleya hyalina]|uniref:Uncharacterized protein n=1 Tax=Embleya hyalina TaxID=516124 RepID=A0A401YNK6_9ACTN|nr:hypothetical protein EHYA_03877 [Embleya hyalina]
MKRPAVRHGCSGSGPFADASGALVHWCRALPRVPQRPGGDDVAPAPQGWLTQVWSRTRSVRVAGGDETVIARVDDGDVLADFRRLTSEGNAVGKCRCVPTPVLMLHARDGELLASAGLHHTDRVAWTHHPFERDLRIGDPLGLGLLLAGHGWRFGVTQFVAPLTLELGLETEPEWQRIHDTRQLAAWRTPRSLVPALTTLSPDETTALPPARIEELRERLASEHPDPTQRAITLLTWLGGIHGLLNADLHNGAVRRSQALARRPPPDRRRAHPAPTDRHHPHPGPAAVGAASARLHRPRRVHRVRGTGR